MNLEGNAERFVPPWLARLREGILFMWPAKLLSLSAAVLLYFFVGIFGLSQYEITVPITYLLPEGYVHGREFAPKTRLIFRGDAQMIATLKEKGITESDFVVQADLRSKSEGGSHRVGLVVRALGTGEGSTIQGFERAEPAEVLVVLEKASTKELPVLATLSGKPKSGFELGDYGVIPERVVVQGPVEVLRDLGSVSTETINLNDRDQSFVQRYRVQTRNPLVSVKGSDVVTVRVSLRSGQEITVQNNVSIRYFGLGPGLVIKESPVLGRIRFRASALESADLDGQEAAAEPRLLVDVGSILQPGSYTLKTIPEVPLGAEILEVYPTTVRVEVEAAPSGSVEAEADR